MVMAVTRARWDDASRKDLSLADGNEDTTFCLLQTLTHLEGNMKTKDHEGKKGGKKGKGDMNEDQKQVENRPRKNWKRVRGG